MLYFKFPLKVITDFDHTITGYRSNTGERVQSCHEALESHPFINDTIRNELRALRSKYLPIGMNYQKLHADEIQQLMSNWWTESHNLLISAGVTRKMIVETLNYSRISLREKFSKFVNKLHDFSIPLTIFSAGLGDVIDLVLQNAKLKTDSIEIVANFFHFNDKNEAVEFFEPTIHMCNKNMSTMIKMKRFNDNLSLKLSRPNIILLGDSLYDIHMTDGYELISSSSQPTVIRIGWLNQKSNAEVLQKYSSIYDIVLTEEETFTVPNLLIKWITTQIDE
uniref:5'-nucleotidase n=1 Tax=Trichobilharzia regenti TaxID=157069 RepID=A0AA85JQB3_TRIRE|nr:unnamed protein product [Trichobilharzia regenti]